MAQFPGDNSKRAKLHLIVRGLHYRREPWAWEPHCFILESSVSALCNVARLFQYSDVCYTNPLEKKVQTETASAFAGKTCTNMRKQWRNCLLRQENCCLHPFLEDSDFLVYLTCDLVTKWGEEKSVEKSHVCVCESLQSCLTLCDPMDCSPPGSSVHGILQARILEWVAMPSSRGKSHPFLNVSFQKFQAAFLS